MRSIVQSSIAGVVIVPAQNDVDLWRVCGQLFVVGPAEMVQGNHQVTTLCSTQ